MTLTLFGRKGAHTLSVAMAVILLAACETTPTSKPVSLNATSVPKADFSSYKTYYVLEVPPGENKVAPPKPFSRVVVEAAVRDELDTRNYREITDKDSADMLVAIQFSLEDEKIYKEKTTYETQISNIGGYGAGYGTGYGRGYGSRGYGGSYGRRGYGGGYGSRYSGYSYGYGYSNYYGYTTIPRSTIVTEDFRQGNMVIDLIDPTSNSVVWEGHARGEGEHEPAKIEARVKYVVSGLFKKYPHEAELTLDAAP